MWKSFRGRMSGGHLRPLAATCDHSSGCKWPQVAAGDKRMLAANCGHLRPLEWLQVAAISKIKLRASCVLNVVSLRSHPVHVSRESPLSPSFSTSGTERGGHKTSTTAYFLPTLEDRTPSFTCFLRLRSCFLEIPPCFLLEETPWTA